LIYLIIWSFDMVLLACTKHLWRVQTLGKAMCISRESNL
jgi:hypothetical protein